MTNHRKTEIEKLKLEIEDLSSELVKQGFKIQRLQVAVLDIERKEALLKKDLKKLAPETY